MFGLLKFATFGLKGTSTLAKSLFLGACSHCIRCCWHKYATSRNKTSMICSNKNKGPHKEVFLTRQPRILLYLLPMTIGWETLVQKKFSWAKASTH